MQTSQTVIPRFHRNGVMCDHLYIHLPEKNFQSVSGHPEDTTLAPSLEEAQQVPEKYHILSRGFGAYNHNAKLPSTALGLSAGPRSCHECKHAQVGWPKEVYYWGGSCISTSLCKRILLSQGVHNAYSKVVKISKCEKRRISMDLQTSIASSVKMVSIDLGTIRTRM